MDQLFLLEDNIRTIFHNAVPSAFFENNVGDD